ncbi:hypothetical protein JOQ06_020056, partial [Pogonophryne albipinna]
EDTEDTGGVRPEERGGVRPEERGGVRPEERGGVRRGGVRPEERGGVRPEESGGVRPEESGGVRPEESGGVRPEESGGVRPEESGGVRPEESGGVRPEEESGEEESGRRREEESGRRREEESGRRREEESGRRREEESGRRREEESGRRREEESGRRREEESGWRREHTLNVTQDIIRSMKDLESDIVELETISETTGDRGYIEILKEKKMALANLLDVKVQGALVRSRFLNTNEMDAPTSFFFGLEKKNGQRRVIHSLLSDTGQEITEPSQIRMRAVSFYSTLYTSEYEEGETLSEGFCNELPQVSEETNSQLEGPLTIQELQTALQGMQGRRAPGIDGLSVEFYKAYWDVLSHDLLDVFNESLASGSMPMSCRRAVITLLPKKGNLQDIKNWRPVSAVCGLQTSVQGFGHQAGEGCGAGHPPGPDLLCARQVHDQEKAFERVEHSFLWKVMEKFGFSAGFIAKIKVLYNKIESVLKFNEPLIHKARLDVSSSETPGLTVALCRSKTLCLQQLVDAVGPELSDARALGSLLGLHSVQVAERILQLWSQILSPDEKRLLRGYGQGRAKPDPADPFPEIYLSPGLGELTGPLLKRWCYDDIVCSVVDEDLHFAQVFKT